MKINETNYPNFKWIDIQNPTVADLAAIQKRLEIDTHYLEDALEQGHLPKIEKSANMAFIILRAYTARENESHRSGANK